MINHRFHCISCHADRPWDDIELDYGIVEVALGEGDEFERRMVDIKSACYESRFVSSILYGLDEENYRMLFHAQVCIRCVEECGRPIGLRILEYHLAPYLVGKERKSADE